MHLREPDFMEVMATERRTWLDNQLASGRVDPRQLAAARAALGLVPSALGWQRIMTGALAAAGLALLAAALIFAVAFNWDALGHFLRLALVQSGVVLFAVLAWWRGTQTLLGESALLAACLATGALLALFGQTYQTGADPYSLFVVWAGLILPWAFHACRVSVWLLWIVVANTGLALYCGQVLGEFVWIRLFGHMEVSAGMAILFNLGLFALSEGFPVLGTAGLGRAVPRVLAVLVLAAVAGALIPAISRGGDRGESPLYSMGMAGLAVSAFGGLGWWSLRRRCDVPVLAAAALCAVSVGFALLLRVLPQHSGDSIALFFVGAVYWIGAIAVAVWWLRGVRPNPEDASAVKEEP